MGREEGGKWMTRRRDIFFEMSTILTVPSTRHPTASTSPQYRTLHQDKLLRPPSSSRLPTLGVEDCRRCASAFAARESEAPSRVVLVWVGVSVAREGAMEGMCLRADATEGTSTSTVSCQEEREGCSRHS